MIKEQEKAKRFLRPLVDIYNKIREEFPRITFRRKLVSADSSYSVLYRVIFCVAIIAFLIFFLPTSYPVVIARWISGIALALYIPGFVLVKALFLATGKSVGLHRIQEIMLGFALSLVVTASIGYLLSFFVEVTLPCVFLSMSTIIVLVAAVSAFLRQRRSLNELQTDSNVVARDSEGKGGMIALLLIFGFAIVIRYAGIVIHNYFVIPGDDQYYAAGLSEIILRTGRLALPERLQPAGVHGYFYILTAILSELMNLTPLELYKLLAPSLIALSTLAVYTFTKESLGGKPAIFASFVYGLMARQPTGTLWDGGYPNIVAADILLILALAFLIRVFKNGKMFDVIIVGILFGGVFSYHLLSAIYLAMILACLPILFAYIIYTGKNAFSKFKLLMVSAFFLFVFGILPAWNFYLRFLLNTISSIFVGGSTFEAAIGRADTPLSLQWYPDFLGEFVIYGGAMGLLTLILKLLKRENNQKEGAIILAIWTSVMFLGSRTSWVITPVRFARDLSPPLSILAGLFLYWLLQLVSRTSLLTNKIVIVITLKEHRKKEYVTKTIFAIVIALVLSSYLTNEVSHSLQYNRLVRLTPKIYEGMVWLDEREKYVILASPFMDLPLFAVTGQNVILPGAQPKDFLYRLNENDQIIAHDSWQVLDHPNQPASFYVMEKYNITFIFILKTRPYYWGPEEAVFVNYSSFTRSPFYETVFENEEVLIVKPLFEFYKTFIKKLNGTSTSCLTPKDLKMGYFESLRT